MSLVEQFCSITGASIHVAENFLEATGHNLEIAINWFLESVPIWSPKPSKEHPGGSATNVEDQGGSGSSKLHPGGSATNVEDQECGSKSSKIDGNVFGKSIKIDGNVIVIEDDTDDDKDDSVLVENLPGVSGLQFAKFSSSLESPVGSFSADKRFTGHGDEPEPGIVPRKRKIEAPEADVSEDVPELKLFKRLAEALGETVENVANLNSWERDNLLHVCGITQNEPQQEATIPPPPPSSKQQTFSVTRCTAKRTVEADNFYEQQFIIAESRFFRLLSLKDKSVYKITTIDVIENSVLEARFNNKQEEFRQLGIPCEPIFAFHGTSQANIDSIIKNNFNLDLVKVFAHGFGIYFSERPEVSTGYTSKDTGGRLIKRPKGKISSMILCKILLGNPGVNSKEVKDKSDERSWAIVIGTTNGVKDYSTMNQILPAFVVNYTT